jgi:predicted enzyme related to lactoylglutathione lyase
MKKTLVLVLGLVMALLGAQGSRGEDGAAAAPGLKLTNVVVLVGDQEEALRWYTEKLGLEKRVDESYGEGERWVTVAAKGSDLELTLQKAPAGAKGNIAGSTRWVFSTDDCQKAYETLSARGVKFLSPPKSQPWGVQAVFTDPYGNEFFLVGSPKG